MIDNIGKAVKYLGRYIPTPDKKHPGELGLLRMQYLMGFLGNPQLKYPSIHVGGTSGKGSTATIIASILSTKYKVGLHTSPHLVKINERIKVFDKRKAESGKREVDVSDKYFIGLVDYIKPFVGRVEKSKFGPPSYFEIVTGMAFLHFYIEKVDIAVIEVGMGGRYDATNVIKPLVAVITNVGLDHTEILGDTVEKIARDKTGIIKSGIKVVTGVKQPSVIDIIKRKALSVKRKDKNNNLSIMGRDFHYKIKSIGREGSVFDYYGKSGSDLARVKGLTLSLLGEYQVENAALAVRAIELLYRHSGEQQRHQNRFWTSQNDLEKSIRQGLECAFIPGRLEIIHRKPLVILDGAHNPDKMRALVASVKKIFPNKKITTIIAVKNDKDVKEMLAELVKLSKKLIFTKFQIIGDIGVIASYDPQELLRIAKTIAKNKQMLIIEDAKKAVEETIKSAKPGDLILITGSLYLIGNLKKDFL